MKLPIPIFFIASAVFIFFCAFHRSRQTRRQDEVNESFLERERLANATRKKDISSLNFLAFDAGQIAFPICADETLLAHEAVLKELSGQKIINLSSYSNTDLKLMYGPANLNELTEYDENYSRLSASLLAYAERAAELGFEDAAISVLEYAMELAIDSRRIYLLLAELYCRQHREEKISGIRTAISNMNPEFASFVLPKLNDPS